MELIPAIDLVGGKCVRLIQGEYHRQITYEDDPVKQAQKFLDAGADWLHIIDLDGARVGKPVNIDTAQAITAGVKMKFELGGGVRDEQAIRRMLDIGIDRVIIGTSAIRMFDWFTEMTEKFPNKLVLGLDARGSKLATSGWTQESQQEIWVFAAKAANLPLAAIIYTDITKDGMMAGPNLERTKALVDAVDVPIIAAGGVTEIDDVVKLRQLGVAGAIAGRALYEGNLNLKEAIKAAHQEDE